MNSNVQARIFSALLMTSLVVICFFLGRWAFFVLILILLFLTHDEIFCNFLKQARFSFRYFQSLSIAAIPYIIITFILKNAHFLFLLSNLSILLCALLVIYLFYVEMESPFLTNLLGKFPFIVGIYLLLSTLPLANLFFRDDWKGLCWLLFAIVFGMDTGAWFFGIRFGKRKLWPAVSPKKTLEGFFGGALVAGLCGGMVANIIWGKMNLGLFFLFVFMGIVSQVGDLIQSKIKRQFFVKDSSKLIPGHGGVYDRIDSLIFLTPVFLGFLKLLGR